MALDPSIILATNADQISRNMEQKRQTRVVNAQNERDLALAETREDRAVKAEQERARTNSQALEAMEAFSQNPADPAARNRARALAPKFVESLDKETQAEVQRQNARNVGYLAQVGPLAETGFTEEQMVALEDIYDQVSEDGGLPPGVTFEQFATPEFYKEQAGRTMAIAMGNKTLPTAARNAIAAGYLPGSTEFQKALSSSRETNINVDTKGPRPDFDAEKLAELNAKNTAAAYERVSTRADSARDVLETVSFSRVLLEGAGEGDELEVGALTPLLTKIQGLGEALGFDVGVFKDLSRAEAFNMVTQDFVAKMRIAETKGSISDSEMRIFQQSVPGLSKTVAGNRLMLGYTEAIAQRNIRREALWSRHLSDPTFKRSDLQAALNEMSEESIFSAEDIQTMQRTKQLGVSSGMTDALTDSEMAELQKLRGAAE